MDAWETLLRVVWVVSVSVLVFAVVAGMVWTLANAV